jgi:hypothetical protein
MHSSTGARRTIFTDRRFRPAVVDWGSLAICIHCSLHLEKATFDSLLPGAALLQRLADCFIRESFMPSAKNRLFLSAILAALGCLEMSSSSAMAVTPPTASATITPTAGSPNSYALTLSDDAASPSTIGTFWFAWVPGKDFMTTSPLSVSSPSGWTDTITGGGTGDGYAIQWKATSSSFDVAPGSSLSGFAFTSADSPGSVFGNSVYFPTRPVLTSVAYSAGPFSDAGTTFAPSVVSVPEPTALVAAAPLAMLLRRRRGGRAAL